VAYPKGYEHRDAGPRQDRFSGRRR
jgi:hypothetical protein